MRGNVHVRFGGRIGETGRQKHRHGAPVRPYYFTPFTRCMACNGALIPVAKKEIAHRLSPQTSRHVDDFRVCSSCNKVYWQWAHYPELRRIVAAARRADRVAN